MTSRNVIHREDCEGKDYDMRCIGCETAEARAHNGAMFRNREEGEADARRMVARWLRWLGKHRLADRLESPEYELWVRDEDRKDATP